MKRTVEIVFSVIGALLYVLMAAFGAVMVWVDNNKDVVQKMIREANEQGSTANQIPMTDLNNMLNTFGSGGIFLIIASIIAIIVGIISIVLIKGNKKPKAAGILLIVTAIVVSVITSGGGIIGGIFYLITGIMCLARKPKTLTYA
ncbi:DUF4064 domain-containing protein [Virgibacillus flavescens]|uniref:DUF4064 domain-containing protein n=1 Tax=Virgibacillus flavescens TaxID=1611422 RepID=UPI003D340F14